MERHEITALARTIGYTFFTLTVLCLFFSCAAWDHKESMGGITTGPLDPKTFEDKVFENGKIDEDADVLYLLELGSIYSALGQFENSNQVLEAAYERYTEREEEALLGARKVGKNAIDVLFGEGSREYELADYEKVYIHTVKSMNYLMLGDVDSARVETKRGIERHKKIREYTEFESAEVEESKRDTEKQIQDLKALMAKQEEESLRAHKSRTRRRENLKPYDLDKNLAEATRKADLPPPLKQKIMSVRNSYENSFTYLMAALNFSLCGEKEHVGPELRKAGALTRNPCVGRILSGSRRSGSCMVSGRNLYVFAQVGLAPTKENLNIPFPNPLSRTVCQFSMARIKPSDTHIGSIELRGAGSGRVGRLEPLTDMELLPLKEYEDKLPENVSKAILRVIAQSLRDAGIVSLTDENDKLVRRIVQGALSIFNMSVAKADTRTWLTAPKSVLFYSGRVNSPDLTIAVRNKAGEIMHTKQVKIDPGKINLVNLRCFDHGSYVHNRCFNAPGGGRGFARPTRIPPGLHRLTIVSSNGGNIREKPSTRSRIIVALPQGRKLRMQGKQGQWFQVVTPSGHEGWAHKSLFGPTPAPESIRPTPQPTIQPIPPRKPIKVPTETVKTETPPAEETKPSEKPKIDPPTQVVVIAPQPEKKYIIILESKVGRVYENPNGASKRIGLIPARTRVEYFEKKEGFYRVKYKEKMGFVYKSYCKEIE